MRLDLLLPHGRAPGRALVEHDDRAPRQVGAPVRLEPRQCLGRESGLIDAVARDHDEQVGGIEAAPMTECTIPVPVSVSTIE